MASNVENRPGVHRPKVAAGVERFRDIYAQSLEMRERLGGRGKYGKRTQQIAAEAKRRNTNVDYIRKMIKMADPEAGFTADEINAICRLATTHRRIIGLPLAMKLLTIADKGERQALAEKVLVSGWSLNEMDIELVRRFGRRRQGGRNPARPPNVKAALVQIENMTLAWTRWYAQIAEVAESGGVTLADLPDDVQRGLGLTEKTVRRLGLSVARHLTKARVTDAQ